MSQGFWLTQDGHIVNILPPVSAGAAQTGVRFTMAMYAHASILVRFGASGGPTGAVTLNVFNALTGGSGVPIPFRYFLQNAASAPFDVFGSIQQATAAGYTPSSDVADADLLIELDAAEILAARNGTYVELDIAVGSLGTTPQLLDGLAILSGGRFQEDMSDTTTSLNLQSPSGVG